MAASLPIIDISPLYNNGGDVLTVGKEIDKACREVGFFYIVGHPIPEELLTTVRELSVKFFKSPLEKKLEVDKTKINSHRGYVKIGEERLDYKGAPCVKESFDMSYNLPSDHPCVVAGKPYRGQNNHPTFIEGWEETLERYYATMNDLALDILGAITTPLGLEPDFFRKRYHEHASTLRLVFYPSDKVGFGQQGCGEHSDYDLITILNQDTTGGLQVRDQNGDWIEVTPIEGSFVVNVADLLKRWANDMYRSAKHRVICPGVDRYVTVFFSGPHPETIIECLPSCQSPSNPPKHPPISYIDYLFGRYNVTYSYRQNLDERKKKLSDDVA